LLELSRTEVRGALDEFGLKWREDSSNQNQHFVRNRLRLTTLPNLARTFNPKLEEALAGTAELCRVEEEYWAQQISALYHQLAKTTSLGPVIDVKALTERHPAVKRRLIRHAISRAKGSLRSIDRLHVDAVLRLIESPHAHDRVNIPGVDAIRSFDHLLLATPEALKQERHYSVTLEIGVRYELPYGAGALRLTIPDKTNDFCDTVEDGSGCNGEEASLNPDAVCLAASTGDLAVRNWQPGDKLQPVGQGSSVKVKTLFQEHKVFLWRRKHWPVIVAGKEIVWVRKFGVAQQFAASQLSSKRVRLCFEADE
jgi:tRNA(Ile)-lysidine synthase